MMRVLLLIAITLFTFKVSAQQQAPLVNDLLQFDQPHTRCEKQWVITPSKEKDHYVYGYIYIDHQAGFTYDVKGNFTINADGTYKGDTTAFSNSLFKVRIPPNWGRVALLPPSHYKELNLKAEPSWLKGYYTYTDTLAHNFRWGWIYNDSGDSEVALIYLNKVYQIKPHANGLEFELAFAYNALNRPNEAITILEAAIKNSPKDVTFYRELGYAYLNKKDYPKSIQYYLNGIELCTDKQLDTKSEMALNLSNAYKRSGNESEGKTWMGKAKEWAPVGSKIAAYLKNQN